MDFNADGFASSGDQIQYEFIVTKTRNNTLTDVMVTDPMVLVIGDPVTLLPGESTIFTVTYIITERAVVNGQVKN